MPRAFLVKKRGPKRGSPVSSINAENHPTTTLQKSQENTERQVGWSSATVVGDHSRSDPPADTFGRDDSPSPGELRGTDGGLRVSSAADRTDSPTVQKQGIFEGERPETKAPRYQNPEATLPPPPGAAPMRKEFSSTAVLPPPPPSSSANAALCASQGGYTPDAAAQADAQFYQRPPPVPTVIRSIGYITSSPSKDTPRITIQRSPPDELSSFSPPGPSLSHPALRRSASPKDSAGQEMVKTLKPSGSIWAPHRDLDQESRADSYYPYQSPPSYRNILSFSPELPDAPHAAPPTAHNHLHGKVSSPGGLPFDLDRSGAHPLTMSRSQVIAFDSTPKPPAPQLSPSALRQAGNAPPSAPLGAPLSHLVSQPLTVSSSLSLASSMHSTTNLPPPLDASRPPASPLPSFLSPRVSPKSILREESKDIRSDEDFSSGGRYDRHYQPLCTPGYVHGGGQSIPLNMSAIKESNGSRTWRSSDPGSQRLKPRIPWGIENIPMDPNHLKPLIPANKKRRENEPPRYQCEACKKSYATHGGLSKHKQFHCISIIKKEFSCKHCDKTYVSLGALKMHIRTHTLPCKCTICGKAFARPWLLQGHIRTHTGEKPYQCAHCGRSFADRSNLRAHLQTHTDIKKYNCRTCSKSFSRMSLLTKHEDGVCGNSAI